MNYEEQLTELDLQEQSGYIYIGSGWIGQGIATPGQTALHYQRRKYLEDKIKTQELIKARDIIIDVIGEGINAETNIQLENGRHFLTKTILEIDEIIKLTK